MSCGLLTRHDPEMLPLSSGTGTDATGSAAATRILDLDAPATRSLADAVGATDHGEGRAVLRAAHALIAASVRPVYSLDERRPVSRTLRLGRGSCSQRFAALEAVARSHGIRTRSRGLVVDGAFWRPRFRALAPALPAVILVAWPEFRVDGAWTSAAGAIVGRADDGAAFTNSGSETLFDAVGRGAVDWRSPGVVACDCEDAAFASFVRRDLGTFDSRDELFGRHGVNLPAPVRVALEPVLGRWSAGAA